MSRVPHPYTAEHADAWFEIISQQELNLNIFLNNSLVGGIGLTQDQDQFYEFGYWLGRDYWGLGYATEAGKALLQYTTQELNLTKIKSGYMVGNISSANVLRKLGFEVESEEDIYIFSRDETVPSIKLLLR